MTQILYSNQTIRITIPSGQSIAISTASGSYSAYIVNGFYKDTVLATNSSTGAVFGPYINGGAVVELSVSNNAIVSYDVGVSPVLTFKPDTQYSLDANGDVNGFIAPDGSVIGLVSTASLAAYTGASLVGHIDDVAGSVATTVQARLRKMPDKSGGFWPDSSPVGVIQRMYDRVYIGGATIADGTIANTVKDWLETERQYTTRNSQLACTSTIGQLAVLGGSRSSDSLSPGSMGCIGVGAYVINNNATQVQSAYAGYFEARRKTGAGITHGIEIDVVNQGDSIFTNPFGSFSPTGMTNGLWVASGGEIAAANASVAIGIVNNGAAFNSGIVFQANSITGTDGVTGTGNAIAFAKGHVLSWYNSAGSQTSNIYSGAASANLGAGVYLGDGTASFVNSGAGGAAKFTVSYGASDVNYIGTTCAVTGLPANLQAMGSDTDIDIRLSPKGAGVLAVTYGSDAATTPSNFSASRRLAFKDGNNITWYIPISTVAW